MAERQIAHRLERLVSDADHLGIGPCRIDQVAMGEHRALRRSRRARGVDENADVIGRALRDQPVERRLRIRIFARKGAAALAQRFKGHQLRLAIVAQALHVDADDGFQIRQALVVGERVKHLVGLFLVAGDDNARAGMPHDILQLDPRIGRVDTDSDGADHLGAQIGVKPFRRVLARNRHAVAGLDTERHQPQRHGPRRLIIMSPGIGIPDAKILFAQRQFFAVHGGALAQQLRNGDGRVLQGRAQRGGGGVRQSFRRARDRWLRRAHGVDGGHQALAFASVRWPPR